MTPPARTPETDRIAARAYALWEEEGRPHGRDEQHWQRAESEVSGTGASAAAPTNAPTKKPRARKADAPKVADAGAKPARSRGAASAEPADKSVSPRKAAAASVTESPAPKRQSRRKATDA
jgi:hypothetical protein